MTIHGSIGEEVSVTLLRPKNGEYMIQTYWITLSGHETRVTI